MIDTEKDIQDNEFRVITHSDFYKRSSRTYLKKIWWVLIPVAVAALIALGFLFL